MTRVLQILKPYQQSGALHTQIPVQEAVDEHSFLTKAGYVFQFLKVGGVDDECLDPGQVDHIAQRVESALRLLDESFRLYQYLIKAPAKPIGSASSEVAVVQEALANRNAYLNSKQLGEIQLY